MVIDHNATGQLDDCTHWSWSKMSQTFVAASEYSETVYTRYRVV